MAIVQYLKLDKHHGKLFSELQVGEYFLHEGNIARRVQEEAGNVFVYANSSVLNVTNDISVVVIDQGQIFFGDDTVEYIGDPPPPEPVVEPSVSEELPTEELPVEETTDPETV